MGWQFAGVSPKKKQVKAKAGSQSSQESSSSNSTSSMFSNAASHASSSSTSSIEESMNTLKNNNNNRSGGQVEGEERRSSSLQPREQSSPLPSSTAPPHVHPAHRQSVYADNAHAESSLTSQDPTYSVYSPTDPQLAPQRRLPLDNPHGRPLSSYTRSPLPGISNSTDPAESPASVAPFSPAMSSLASNNGKPTEASTAHMGAGSDAAVSEQIRNLANMIVSPVPQRHMHVVTQAATPAENGQRGRRRHHHDHDEEMTLEEMQERALSTAATTRNNSTVDLHVDYSDAPPVPQIPPSFSIIDQPERATRRSDSSRPASSIDHNRSQSPNSPPKPKLRNLDTSMLAARSKVSSFFGGLSDSLTSAGGHPQQRQNSTNGILSSSSSSFSSNNQQQQPQQQQSLSAAQSIPVRESSPQPQPSSSFPSTSHMQPPPSSVAQTRSQSQPLQHHQIPQYAIPQQQYHGQHPSISSTATGSSSNLHPRSSFYGLDGHVQQQQGAENGDSIQATRWRSDRRASPSPSNVGAGYGGGNPRPASHSIPRSETGHYTSPSLGGTSSFGGYAGSNEAPTRRRVTSWTTRSNASSVYGLSSPQLAPSTSGDLPPVPPVPHLTQAHLRPGHGVSLLSHQKTLDMYRANVKKTNDPEVTFELAQFMLGIAREMAAQEMASLGGPPMAPGLSSMNGFTLNGVSEENLLSSLNDHGDSSSPSPDPSFSFHSRSSGSSGDLAAAAAGLQGRAVSSQGIPHQHQQQQQNAAATTAAGLSKRRGSHSPAPSISTTRLAAVGMNRTGSPTSGSGGGSAAGVNDRRALVAEALSLLKRSADRGHVASQYFLADIYANGGMENTQTKSSRASIYAHAKDLLPGGGGHANGGGTGSGNVSPMDSRMNPSPTGSAASLTAPPFFNNNNAAQIISSPTAMTTTTTFQKPDFDKALPLFIAAAKHGHAPSCFRAGECFENGWGCRKDSNKAVQFYRKSAASSFPEAMYRLGMAELNGELGLKDRQKEGFKWLKQVAALAESNNENNNNGAQELSNGTMSSSPSGGPMSGLDDQDGTGNTQGTRLCTVQALHELALLHERGIDNVVFVDNEYAAELLARASELGYAPSAYKLGECYEYGRMGCPQDAALSIHYYNIAAQQNHREACFALTAWYLVGSPGVLPQSDTEAYLWAKKAAEQGLAKAEYAVGYFTEVGIGTIKDERDAIQWFRKAAEHGDKRAITRLRTLGVRTEDLPIMPVSPRSAKTSTGRKGPRMSLASNSSAAAAAAGGDHHAANGNAAATAKEGKRRSRRSTLPGLMGMTKEDRPPVPSNGQGGNGKKADGDCVIC